jgi:NOL1/NOP2/sun family putative RNA methylase
MLEMPEGLIIRKGWKKVGSSQSYLNGYVMPQGYGSMLAVHALDPLPGDFVLDMAAAPGGKSCFIAERLQNRGQLVANEKSHKRIQSLINNLMRHSIDNVVVTHQDALSISTNNFDKILLDAPCSGDGLIVSTPSRRKKKSLINSYSLQRIQITLLSKAFSLLKPRGTCVYSTCSINSIENESVLENLFEQFSVEQINIPGNPGLQTIHQEFSKTKRLLPSQHYCDGFFIAKLQKR